MMLGIVANCFGRTSGPSILFISIAAASMAIAGPASAQSDNLHGTGGLVRQDFSDCGNGNVSDSDPSRVGGGIVISQTPAGATTAAVEIVRGTPNTSYTLYWKCQRALGTIQTDAGGFGTGSFQFQASTGQELTFDMYPDGAPLGNKFQSTPIWPAYIGVGPLVRQDFSDCGNTNVIASDASRVGGSLVALQNSTGATTVSVEVDSGTPNTAYTLYWKCQRALGIVQTDANGAGTGSFQLQTAPGTVLTFDMYPDGAPAGNKFQSVRLLPAPSGPAPMAR
jgi:hypothetical protein